MLSFGDPGLLIVLPTVVLRRKEHEFYLSVGLSLLIMCELRPELRVSSLPKADRASH